MRKHRPHDSYNSVPKRNVFNVYIHHQKKFHVVWLTIYFFHLLQPTKIVSLECTTAATQSYKTKGEDPRKIKQVVGTSAHICFG